MLVLFLTIEIRNINRNSVKFKQVYMVENNMSSKANWANSCSWTTKGYGKKNLDGCSGIMLDEMLDTKF